MKPCHSSSCLKYFWSYSNVLSSSLLKPLIEEPYEAFISVRMDLDLVKGGNDSTEDC